MSINLLKTESSDLNFPMHAMRVWAPVRFHRIYEYIIQGVEKKLGIFYSFELFHYFDLNYCNFLNLCNTPSVNHLKNHFTILAVLSIIYRTIYFIPLLVCGPNVPDSINFLLSHFNIN